jgi:uncharacterized repeat protein (TIGR03803 family)
MERAKLFQIAVTAVVILFTCIAPASGEDKVIGRFDLKHGANPQVGLVADSRGDLFGVAPNGGSSSCGEVFELAPASGGGWTQTVVYYFKGGASDGCTPASQLVLDGQGNLFGTTSGGLNSPETVFELSPAGGAWEEKSIYTFTSVGIPGVQLAIDQSGNLFGSLEYGGSEGRGAIFVLHRANGTWAEELIWQFSGGDGAYPLGGVSLGSEGNLYGTTSAGANGSGTVFELSPKGGGDYALRTIYAFQENGGWGDPMMPLAIDGSGNLFGVTSNPVSEGPPTETPVAFELSPTGNVWKLSILHVFSELSKLVKGSPSGFTVDANGNLYGVTATGGGNTCNVPGCGTVYELSPPTNGSQWGHKVLYEFQSAEDGSYPVGNLLLLNGQLYGTTEYGGGMFGYGTVFSVTP